MTEFLEICVDSGAQCSIFGLPQAKAYMKKFGAELGNTERDDDTTSET